jgi:hypothetical protein
LRSIFVFAGIGAALLVACGGGGGSSGPAPTVAAIGTSTPAPSATPATKPTVPPTTAPTGTPTGTPTGSATATPTAAATAAPTAAPSGVPAVVVSPGALAFFAAGTGAAKLTAAVSQTGNTAGFHLSTTNCTGIVTAAPATGAGPFTFTPLQAGTCSFTVSGSGGAQAALTITVTTTSVKGS